MQYAGGGRPGRHRRKHNTAEIQTGVKKAALKKGGFSNFYGKNPQQPT
jgi:hypothetical protein